MNKGFENILDACIDHIALEGDRVENCVKSYPEQEAGLEPLLRVAVSMKNLASVQPRPEFQQAAKARLLTALARQKEKEKRHSWSVWKWHRRWAIAVAALLILLVASGGTVLASSNSLPGDLLYPAKTSVEKVRSFFTFSDKAKANLYVELAQRRADEVEALAEKGRDVPVSVVNVMISKIERAIALADKNEAVRERLAVKLVNLTSNQRRALVKIIESAPEETRSKIVQALKRLEISHARAVVLSEGIKEEERVPVQEGIQTPENVEGGAGPDYQENPIRNENTQQEIPVLENDAVLPSTGTTGQGESTPPLGGVQGTGSLNNQGNATENQNSLAGTPAPEDKVVADQTDIKQDTSTSNSQNGLQSDDLPAQDIPVNEPGTDQTQDTNQTTSNTYGTADSRDPGTSLQPDSADPGASSGQTDIQNEENVVQDRDISDPEGSEEVPAQNNGGEGTSTLRQEMLKEVPSDGSNSSTVGSVR